MLKDSFFQLLNNYTAKTELKERLWLEIEKKYTHKNRYYHTLQHLSNLINELESIKTEVIDWNTILFSVYYHDIIYNTLKKDNEEKSALLSEKRLTELSIPPNIIAKIKNQILATKTHLISSDNDTNLFIDADLSILGKNWDSYNEYCNQIRKEYFIYPDIVYKAGRKKVLQHFLKMEKIYKTNLFYEKYELQAKKNIEQELFLLENKIYLL